MVYGAGFFVVTTASSAENVDCYNSADGATWAGQGTGTPDILALNLFDGVRFVGSATFTPNIAFSGNAGATWTQTPAPQFDGINAMAFQGGVYVATDGGSPSVIQKSFSPNWSGTDIIQPLTDDAAAVAFGEGVWCLVGDVLGGTTPQAAISTDLTSWSLEDLGLGAAEFEDMRGVAAAGGVLVAWTFSGKVTTRVVKVAVSWTQTNGNSSTGPLQGAGFDGDGSGFYDATVALNGGFGCGSTVPSPVAYAGAHLSVSGWGSSSPMGGGYYSIVLVGTLPQSFFTKVSLGPPANLTFLTAGANHYSTTDFPGFTVWAWSDSHEFAFFPPLLVTITP
jgi:hypothetical protein